MVQYMKKNKDKDSLKEKGQARVRRRWTLCITVCAFFLSVFMSLFSDMLMKNSNLIIAFIILILIILIGIVFDIVGVAVTVADPAVFNSMASNKVKGAKSSLKLIKHAAKVSNVCNDVIGDTCGIISGASAAYIVANISAAGIIDYAVASVILSGIVASATIGGKALGKDFAIGKSNKIITVLGRAFAVVIER